jgi:hypothetical protein
MEKNADWIRIELDEEQEQQITQACGMTSREFDVLELEQRIAPTGCCSGAHYPSVIIHT